MNKFFMDVIFFAVLLLQVAFWLGDKKIGDIPLINIEVLSFTLWLPLLALVLFSILFGFLKRLLRESSITSSIVVYIVISALSGITIMMLLELIRAGFVGEVLFAVVYFLVPIIIFGAILGLVHHGLIRLWDKSSNVV